MSLDDVYERARALESRLSAFHDSLRMAFDQVMHAHAQVSPYWDDSMRREYDQQWVPLAEAMEDFTHSVGPRYVELLTERMRHLQAFLHGHGA